MDLDQHCIATRGDPGDFESIDTYDDVTFVLKFGFGVYLAQSIILIFSCLAGLHQIAAAFSGLLQCCAGVPATVQVVYLGYYRFYWAGSACAEAGSPNEAVYQFMFNMFIT